MIEKKEKEVSIQVLTPSYDKKKITVYKCSDGTEFTSENDHFGHWSGEQLANDYEEQLQLDSIAKKEMKFHSIDASKNEDYERSFCFYYKPELSKETKDRIGRFVFNIKYSDDVNKLKEGWYLVEQSVYEIPSSGRNCAYDCDGYFGLLSDFIEEKEKNILRYKDILSKVIKL